MQDQTSASVKSSVHRVGKNDQHSYLRITSHQKVGERQIHLFGLQKLKVQAFQIQKKKLQKSWANLSS